MNEQPQPEEQGPDPAPQPQPEPTPEPIEVPDPVTEEQGLPDPIPFPVSPGPRPGPPKPTIVAFDSVMSPEGVPGVRLILVNFPRESMSLPCVPPCGNPGCQNKMNAKIHEEIDHGVLGILDRERSIPVDLFIPENMRERLKSLFVIV